MKESVAVINAYGVSNTAPGRFQRWLKRLGVRVAIISELGNLIDEIEEIGTVYHGRRDKPADVGIAVIGRRVRRKVKVKYIQLTQFIPRPGKDSPKLWRDRHTVRLQIGKTVYWSLHANAAIVGPSGRWTDSEGAKAWREALRNVWCWVSEDIETGLRVRVGGDFNAPESDAIMSPNDFFKSLGMRWVNDGRVMWFGWHPRTDRLVAKKILPTAPGADAHGVLKITLKRRSLLLSKFRK